MPVTAFFRGLAVGALTLGCAGAALAQVPPAASDGGLRRFEIVSGPVTARAGPSETAEPVGVVQGGAILANLGCTLADGAPWCEVRKFRGGARVFVPGRHLAPAATRPSWPPSPTASRGICISCTESSWPPMPRCRGLAPTPTGGSTAGSITCASMTSALFCPGNSCSAIDRGSAAPAEVGAASKSCLRV